MSEPYIGNSVDKGYNNLFPFVSRKDFLKNCTPRDLRWFVTSFWKSGYTESSNEEIVTHFYECVGKYMTNYCAKELREWAVERGFEDF